MAQLTTCITNKKSVQVILKNYVTLIQIKKEVFERYSQATWIEEEICEVTGQIIGDFR